MRNLGLNGASTAQALLYGIFPETSVKFINYILYRWEVTIRTTIVVGFVGASGLGMAFKLAMSFFKYSEITLYMICYLILVYIADLISKLCKDYIRR
ncbi:PhnE/PtxC family ABC transporter permease [Anaerococcus sp. DFU013_CI05]|uniref:ABC transporter permease subunit n=1 Tax=unclassified Anaerococcus TaxID=2614126 RepID=UPI00193265D1|nr:ABC transporter permease subunit [Anaerococcus sp. mt242]